MLLTEARQKCYSKGRRTAQKSMLNKIKQNSAAFMAFSNLSENQMTKMHSIQRGLGSSNKYSGYSTAFLPSLNNIKRVKEKILDNGLEKTFKRAIGKKIKFLNSMRLIDLEEEKQEIMFYPPQHCITLTEIPPYYQNIHEVWGMLKSLWKYSAEVELFDADMMEHVALCVTNIRF